MGVKTTEDLKDFIERINKAKTTNKHVGNKEDRSWMQKKKR